MQKNYAVNNGLLYHIDKRDIDVYVNQNDVTDIKSGTDPTLTYDHQLNNKMTQANYDTFKKKFISRMKRKHKTLKPTDKRIAPHKKLILESPDVNIVIYDNDWSIVIEVLYTTNKLNEITDAQKQAFSAINESARDALLASFKVIYTRAGSWDVDPLTKAIVRKQKALRAKLAVTPEQTP